MFKIFKMKDSFLFLFFHSKNIWKGIQIGVDWIIMHDDENRKPEDTRETEIDLGSLHNTSNSTNIRHIHFDVRRYCLEITAIPLIIISGIVVCTSSETPSLNTLMSNIIYVPLPDW